MYMYIHPPPTTIRKTFQAQGARISYSKGPKIRNRGPTQGAGLKKLEIKKPRVLGRGLSFLFFWRRFRGLSKFLTEFLKPLLSSQKLALGGCQNDAPLFKR